MAVPELPRTAVSHAAFDELLHWMTRRSPPVAGSPTKLRRGLTHNLRRDPVYLSKPMREWLGSMADAHNYGSRNKTLRDLLCLYVALPDTDLKRVLDAGEATEHLGETEEESVLDMHITRQHSEWLASVAETYSLSVSTLLSRLVKFAKEELNEEYVFETHVSCASSTVDLYSDCGIYPSLS